MHGPFPPKIRGLLFSTIYNILCHFFYLNTSSISFLYLIPFQQGIMGSIPTLVAKDMTVLKMFPEWHFGRVGRVGRIGRVKRCDRKGADWVEKIWMVQKM